MMQVAVMQAHVCPPNMTLLPYPISMVHCHSLHVAAQLGLRSQVSSFL